MISPCGPNSASISVGWSPWFRDPQEVRPAPLRPQLVAIRRDSIDTFGTADDGRLFFNERGGVVGSSTYSHVWSEAREFGLPPDLVQSPLADQPYDLRHSALSTWLHTAADPLIRRHA